jgi:hypothetical protein
MNFKPQFLHVVSLRLRFASDEHLNEQYLGSLLPVFK